MNRTELVRDIAERSDTDFNTVDQILAALDAAVLGAIRRSDRITLPGLLTLDVTDRPARTGRSPQDGTMISIPATRVPRIRPGARLKRAANGEDDV